jgi:hypothetical protein
MTETWRPRDSHGHYLASKDVHTTLGPEDWDDSCRHKPAPTELGASAEDFGHEPVLGPPDYRGRKTVCARCRVVNVIAHRASQWDEDGYTRTVDHDPVAWPCTSAIVLGLATPSA